MVLLLIIVILTNLEESQGIVAYALDYDIIVSSNSSHAMNPLKHPSYGLNSTNFILL